MKGFPRYLSMVLINKVLFPQGRREREVSLTSKQMDLTHLSLLLGGLGCATLAES